MSEKYSQLSPKRTASGIEKSVRNLSCQLTRIIPMGGNQRKIGGGGGGGGEALKGELISGC